MSKLPDENRSVILSVKAFVAFDRIPLPTSKGYLVNPPNTSKPPSTFLANAPGSEMKSHTSPTTFFSVFPTLPATCFTLSHMLPKKLVPFL
ncbi:hypothetical protein EF36P3_00001 [Enterococcus phage EF36P3]|nr:hypothetical protein EF36P3_00001 [Enterococcus phage EF36P3]